MPAILILEDRNEVCALHRMLAFVENYRFETSVDGRDWITNVDSGRFGNIQNNPALQEVPFAPVSARFFRFTALKELGTNGLTSAAEFSVLPIESEKGR